MKNFTFPVCGKDWPVRMATTEADLTDFMAWVARQRGVVAVDSEGKGLDVLCGDPDYVRLIQFGTAEEAWVIPTELGAPFKAAARDAMLRLPELVAHNAAFDLLAFTIHLGLDLGAMMRKTWDTQILAKLIDPRQVQEGGIGSGLKPLSAYYIDPSAPDTQGDLTAVFRSLKLTKGTGWAGIDLFHPTYVSYAGGDVILTSRLLPVLRRQLQVLGVSELLVSYEHDLSRICATMSQRGMVLDVDYTRDLHDRLGRECEDQTQIARSFGVEKIGSPRQLADVFLADGETLILPGESAPLRTDNGALKVDKEVLSYLADVDFKSGERLHQREPHPLAVAVLKAKRAGKWQSTYAENFLARADMNGRIHPNIQTMAARTGRMSVTNPAVQTLPKGDKMIRRCFLAEPGEVFISTDFDGVELRVLAALADVRAMKQVLSADPDLHGATARLIWGDNYTPEQRQIAKTINFGVVYGGGAATIARQAGISFAEAEQAVLGYHKAYPEIKRFGKRLQNEAFVNSMVVRSATGRRLVIDRDRAYSATNAVVQSTARDCLGQALVGMDQAGLTPYLRLAIHDETIASAPKAEADEIGREIANHMNFTLFGVDITATPEILGRAWATPKGYEVS
ncbi:DNA polymerase [Streptomyces ovatisporus]|uniref:DNA polymerase I n=1 Tax=Streptomyces ovatisporus TaxID=1128682 RepID=A0ABV9A257_9ACTN